MASKMSSGLRRRSAGPISASPPDSFTYVRLHLLRVNMAVRQAMKDGLVCTL